MKKFFLLIVGMVMALGVQAQGKFAISEGDTYKSTDQVTSVPNITLTFGESGGADFKAAKAGTQIEGYTAFTEGNGTNGNKAGGTFYTFVPEIDGEVAVAVVLNADKKFYVEEDGTALADYNGITKSEKFYGTFNFPVTAGKSYKVYCSGSKLGFYGFEFIKNQPVYDLSEIVKSYMALHAAESSYVFVLEAGAKYILSEPIVTDKSMTITSDKANPAEIDASANSGAFILMSKTPGVEKINNFYRVDHIVIENVKVMGVQNSIFFDNSTAYCVVNFTISNSLFELPTTAVQNEALISFKSGGINDLTIEKSTFYGNNSGAKYFVRYNNNGRVDRYGLETWSMTYKNNTFYGLLKSGGQWGNYNGVAGKAGLMTLTINDNIWYNCDAQTMRRLTQSKQFSNFNKASVMSNNTFWYDGAPADQQNYGNGTDLTTEPLFADAAKGDFTLGLGCDQYNMLTGDPRWLKNFKEGVVELELADGADLTEAINSVYAEKTPDAIKLVLKKLGKYTVSGPLFIDCPLTISGADGVEIDAAGCDAPFILMRPIPETGQNPFGAYEIGELTIKDVTIKNLKDRLFYADRQNYLFGKVNLQNCNISIDGTTPRSLIDFYCGGNTKQLIINHCTLAAEPSNTLRGGLFNTQGSKSIAEMCGEYGQTVTISNSTLYNIAKGVTPVLLERHSQEGLVIELLNNIFDNCGEAGNLIAGMNEGVYDADNLFAAHNAYSYDGADTGVDEQEYDKEYVEGPVIFENVAAGDFSPSVVTNAYLEQAGDPRWLMNLPETSVVIEPASGTDLSTAIAEAIGTKTVNNILVKLAADGQYTASNSIEIAGNLLILGDEEKPATIDGSALQSAFIQMAAIPAAAANRAANEKGFQVIDKIAFTNAMLTGLKYQFFYANKQKYLIKELSVNKSHIAIDGTNKKTIFDFNGGGLTELLGVYGSTIWANPSNATNGAFYSTQSGSKIDEAGASHNVIHIEESTLYNIAYGKTTSTLRQNSQSSQAYYIRKNIIANCGKNGQFLAGLNGGQKGKNSNWLVVNNNITFDGEDVTETEQSKIAGPIDSPVVGPMVFADPDNGDFTLPAKSAQNIAKIGDYCWLVDAPYDAVITIPSGVSISEYLEEYQIELKRNKQYLNNMEINLEKDGQYTINSSIVAPASITIIGENSTIDASALNAPLITTPSEAAETWEISNVLGLIEVNVKGLQKALFASAAKNYCYGLFALAGCVVEQAGDATTFDFTKGSVPMTVNLTNNTFYSPTGTTKSFYSSQGGQKATEIAEDIIQRFVFVGCTWYNLAKGKNFFSHRQANQKWLNYVVMNNLFVDCGKSGQVIRGINGGQSGKNPLWYVNGNAFNFEGEDTSAEESTGDSTEGEAVTNNIAGTISFDNAPAGDFNGVFTLGEGIQAPETLGHNIWTIEYTTPTAIDTVKAAEDVDLENATIYNLNGQRVQSIKKGMYIINGKKVVVK